MQSKHRRVHARESTCLCPRARGCLNFFLARVVDASIVFELYHCGGELWKGGYTHPKESSDMLGHPALPSLRSGDGKLKIFALKQRSLLELEDVELWAHATQPEVSSRFDGR